MPLPRRYDPAEAEPVLMQTWSDEDVYRFDPTSDRPIYSIDTPPPTVSGHLHLGHVYSYSHADFIARYRRMRGDNVFYPIGFDDNGLPTERLVERRLGIDAQTVGRTAFIEKCLEVSEQAEEEYRDLWMRLGLSFDWRHTYRTIEARSRRTCQYSFLELHRKDRVYRRKAPTIWCPACRTAIAQAELNDLEQKTEFVTLRFTVDGATLPVATTRPELLPACVAVFVHPRDPRVADLAGRRATVPLFAQVVPILADEAVDPEKGTGIVMCCTFGDTTDIEWWYRYELPLVEAIGRDGRMTAAAGEFAGLTTTEARARIIEAAAAAGLVLERKPIVHTIRVHERDDVPVEYVVTDQWFVRVLDRKADLIRAGEEVRWHPPHMAARYRDWVENLGWDWCISRQRYFGVPFPVWYCKSCDEPILADAVQLPVDPTTTSPGRACKCGSTEFEPERDVFDTWATSSLTPQIIGRWLDDPAFHARLTPMTLRPQAHEIIRTWAFYTIVQSLYHFERIPWRDVAISGWGLASAGEAKISKSRGGGPMSPMEMIGRYSADAVRYWAASTGLGKDSVISEEKIGMGAKLVTKLWNVAGFAARFLENADIRNVSVDALSPADRWMLARVQRLVRRATSLFEAYDYAAAKAEMETFFWRDLADNYLEMAKSRLYDGAHPQHAGALTTLRTVLATTLALFAPFLPYVTDTIWRGLFATADTPSLHRGPWPEVRPELEDENAESFGEILVAIATAVRRYKSERQLGLGSELAGLELAASEPAMLTSLSAAVGDLRSVSRAREIRLVPSLGPTAVALETGVAVGAGVLEED